VHNVGRKMKRAYFVFVDFVVVVAVPQLWLWID
jgi:hypothetical protein